MFEMDRMMDQFMFCKTNIIFCGPAEWMKDEEWTRKMKHVRILSKKIMISE